MPKKIKETFSFWEERARNVRDVPSVTHPDVFQRRLEIDTIKQYLKKSDRVLDVGCGNGYGTAFYSDFCKKISGMDFSPMMIKRAKVENSKGGRIGYAVADVRNYRSPEKYSKIITTRCLINILDWGGQKKAMKNIARLLEKGGTFLMMEAIADGREELNNLRVRLGLPRLPKVIHNLDFRKARTEKYLRRFFKIEKFHSFGNYEFIVRIIHPLFVLPKQPVLGSKFHEIAVKICGTVPDSYPLIGKFGLWVLKKR